LNGEIGQLLDEFERLINVDEEEELIVAVSGSYFYTGR
jgi:hypothetical protein